MSDDRIPRRGATRASHDTPGKATARRAFPIGMPWILAGIVLGGGQVSHLTWGQGSVSQIVAPLGFSLAGIGVARVAWAYSKARPMHQRRHVGITLILAGLALSLLTSTGLADPVVAPVVGFGAAVLAITWNVRRAEVVRGDGDEKPKQETGWDELLGLPGSQVSGIRRAGPKIAARLQLKGQPIREAQGIVDKVAAYLHVPATAVRIVPDADDASAGEITVMLEDQLRAGVPWPGPAHLGGSPSDPLPIALYEDGEVLAPVLDHGHLLEMGMTGAGKTETAKVKAAERATRRECVQWWCDTVKGDQSGRMLRDAFDWYVGAGDTAGAKAQLAALRALIPYRAGIMGDLGLEKWEPGCGLALLVWHCEEAPAVIPSSETFVRLSQQARSVGIVLEVSMQRATHDNIPTSARANLGSSFCFGVRDSEDAGFALSESTVADGARPEVWRDKRPGYVYVEAPGLEENRWSMPARGFKASTAQLEKAIAAGAAYREPGLTPGELQVIADLAGVGETYARRNNTTRPAPAALTSDDDEDGPVFDPDDDPDGEFTIPPQPDSLADAIDPRAELEPLPAGTDQPLPDEEPEPTGPQLTPAERREVFVRMLADFVGDARYVDVRMAELVDRWHELVGQPAANQRPFLHQRLGELIELRHVERHEDPPAGRYRLLGSLRELVPAPA